MKTALVCGAGGFVGGHLVKRLKQDGFWVRGVDRKSHEFAIGQADDFVLGDLRDSSFCSRVVDQPFDEIYQLAAEMGGAEFIFVGKNDADIMSNSTQIDINVLESSRRRSVKRIFYASSACVYPQRNQMDPENPNCAEHSVYPADPDSDYGWAKLFGERLYLSYARCTGLEARIARYHNIFGPEGAGSGARAKAPAALCRKVAAAPDGGMIDIIGDGMQTRSFLYVSEAIEATVRLMRSDVDEPLNAGSEEMVSINQLVDTIMDIAGKRLHKKYIAGPVGVRGRNSDNQLIRERLHWAPSEPLRKGLEQTYAWIEAQMLSAQAQ